MTTFYEQLINIRNATEVEDDRRLLIRALLESERARNALLDQVIRGETTFEAEVTPLVIRANNLMRRVASPAYPVSDELKTLLPTVGPWISAGRLGRFQEEAESAYTPTGYGFWSLYIISLLFLGPAIGIGLALSVLDGKLPMVHAFFTSPFVSEHHIVLIALLFFSAWLLWLQFMRWYRDGAMIKNTRDAAVYTRRRAQAFDALVAQTYNH